MTLHEYDQRVGVTLLAGVDEAGRGPLAGPVYAAAVILPAGLIIDGLNDSKKLTAKKRDQLYDIIVEKAAGYCIASADHQEIDTLNILGATMLAMSRAVNGLTIPPHLVLVDGNAAPDLPMPAQTVVQGDGVSACIAAASILAKVSRDRYLIELDQEYPQYQFARHKGYPTKLHYEMLDAHGPCPVHRESFLRKWRAAGGR